MGPKEQIMEMAFILDRVPSYILVISKVFSSASEAEDEERPEVAQDEAGPASNSAKVEDCEKPAQKGEVMFRILSLSMLAEESESLEPSVETTSEQKLPRFGDKVNVGAVPTPLEQRDDTSSFD